MRRNRRVVSKAMYKPHSSSNCTSVRMSTAYYVYIMIYIQVLSSDHDQTRCSLSTNSTHLHTNNQHAARRRAKLNCRALFEMSNARATDTRRMCCSTHQAVTWWQCSITPQLAASNTRCMCCSYTSGVSRQEVQTSTSAGGKQHTPQVLQLHIRRVLVGCVDEHLS